MTADLPPVGATVALPLFGEPWEWQVRKRSDGAACALADRHYSRQSVGSGRLGPPGRTLVLVTADETATWLTTWPKYPMDGLDAWRCSIFRNEGPALSSDLIRSAMALTAELWSARPGDGWVTWVDASKVRSTNPGYCFIQAGWRPDNTYVPDRRRPNLRRLVADVEIAEAAA